jgi:predicted MPP superfamily phosphohydrolase
VSDELEFLAARLGPVHARRRLGIERDHEAKSFGPGLNFLLFENWTSSAPLIRTVLRATGLYGRGKSNAAKMRICHHGVTSSRIPAAFDGFTVLHLSDLHVDISEAAIANLMRMVRDLPYDVCVLTGDYRGLTYGPIEAAMKGMARLRVELREPIYAVLGNHDTMRMVPQLEAMGIHVLLNESKTVERHGERIHLAGIDDAHFFRVDNIEKARQSIPAGEFSILLSHTPEVYKQAAHAGFDLMLSGHTHGGQICLPGGIPITLGSILPRRFGSGSWKYHGMTGYTSVGAGSSVLAVRFNCPAELTLHHLRSKAADQ